MMDLVTTGEYVKKTRQCTCQFEQDGCNDQKGSFAAMIKRDVFDSVKYFDLTWKPHIRIAAISARDSTSGNQTGDSRDYLVEKFYPPMLSDPVEFSIDQKTDFRSVIKNVETSRVSGWFGW